jgi:hypothetical protein
MKNAKRSQPFRLGHLLVNRASDHSRPTHQGGTNQCRAVERDTGETLVKLTRAQRATVVMTIGAPTFWPTLLCTSCLNNPSQLSRLGVSGLASAMNLSREMTRTCIRPGGQRI